ncbi:hypothetical protein D3C76_744950 [compost metagenome]
MGLDEQRATTLSLEFGDLLPGVLRMFLRIGADQRDAAVAQVAGGPYRAVFRVDEVGAAAGMGNLADVDQRGELAIPGVDHGDLVGVVGSGQEVAVSAVPAAVVEEGRRANAGDGEVVDVLVVDQQDLAGFLDVDDELGTLVGGDDRGHPWFRVVGLGIHGHAAGGDDLFRLQGFAIHDGVLRRPVGAGDGVFVLVTLVLRGFHRAGLDADLELGDLGRFLRPQVDHVDARVTADDQQIAARGGHPRDVHGIAGVDDLDDLLAVAIHQGDLAGVPQGDGEQVAEVQVVLLFLRPVFRLDQQLPGLAHFRHAPLRRLRRGVLDVLGHQGDLVLAQFAGCAPVGHAGGRTIGDQRFEVLLATLLGDVRRQRLPGGSLAQDAMATGAALEVDLLGLVELAFANVRRTRGVDDRNGGWIDGGGGALILLGCLHLVLGLGSCQAQQRQRGDQGPRELLAEWHGSSP